MKTLFENTQKLFSIGEVQLHYLPRTVVVKNRSVKSSKDAFDILKEYYIDGELRYREIFVVLLLSRSNDVMNITRISEGGISGTVADNKMIFSAALLAGASSIIVSHNHPSGNLTPSQADISLTKKIKASGQNLDIQLLDHLILTPDSFYSFADEGQL